MRGILSFLTLLGCCVEGQRRRQTNIEPQRRAAAGTTSWERRSAKSFESLNACALALLALHPGVALRRGNARYLHKSQPPVTAANLFARKKNAISMATVALNEAPPLVWNPEPDNLWTFNEWKHAPDLKVNYIAAGPVDAQPILLIHGFGASGFHWRRNVNVLAAAGYRVYAIDLIGFGLSSKPVIDYDSRLWREQCATFLREVAGCGEGGKRAIVAGNSIGGYTALMVGAEYPELTLGVASLNGAGRFSPSPEEADVLREAEAAKAQRNALQIALDDVLEKLAASLQRTAAYVGLFVTKQPLRIKQVLQQVYPVSPEAADDELVESIRYPAEDTPGLAPPGQIPEVFYRIVSRNGRGGVFPVDELIKQLQVPLLLLWGEKDPWVVSAMGDRAQACAQASGVDVRRVSVDAGHCPQDEAPDAVNKGLIDFAKELAG